MYYDDCNNEGYAIPASQKESFTWYKNNERGEDGRVFELIYIKLTSLSNEIQTKIENMMNYNNNN